MACVLGLMAIRSFALLSLSLLILYHIRIAELQFPNESQSAVAVQSFFAWIWILHSFSSFRRSSSASDSVLKLKLTCRI